MDNQAIEIKLSAISELATSYWNFRKWVNSQLQDSLPGVMRRYIRKCDMFFAQNGIEMIDLTGQIYDPGLAVEVIHKITDVPPTEAGPEIICETVEPIILLNGQVITKGQIVIK